LFGGIVGTTIGLARAEGARRAEADQRRAAERERDEKEAARAEAVAHLQTARRAIHQLTHVAIDHAAFEPRMEQVWRDLLREALVSSYRHLGWVFSEVGRRDERVAAHRQALAHAEKLAADFPRTPRYQNLLGDTCTIAGCGLMPTQPRGAEALFRRAIDLLDT